jgi:ABC-2 type transport system permease protein
MNSIIGIAVKDTKTFFRERGTVFWTIAFPIMILLLFTAIFGREFPFNANIGVVDYQKDAVSAGIVFGLNSTGVFTIRTFNETTEAIDELNAANLRAVITIPRNFTQNFAAGNASVSLVVDGTNLDVHQLITDATCNFFTEYYKEYYYRLHGANYTAPITVNEEVAVVGQQIGYKENIVPGMLTYPLLFSSMVVSTGAIVFEREKGTLKKIRAAPIRPINMLMGKTLAALFQTAISIAIMATLAYFLLGPKLNWNLPLLIPIFFLGSMNGIALGLIISCIGRAPQEASNAAITIAIVLQFFVGMYFPIDYLPQFMQQIGKVIPMTYAAQALRDIMIRNATFNDLLLKLATLAVSAVILYFVGVLLYRRWVEK